MSHLPALIFILPLVLFGCNSKKSDQPTTRDKATITVGMTYNEVETVLGKPNAIDRGANQLSLSPELIRRWGRLPNDEIETVGQLIYVTWRYSDMKCDTLRYPMKALRTEVDTTHFTTVSINGHECTPEVASTIGDTLYLSSSEGGIISKESYIRLRETIKYLAPPVAQKVTSRKILPKISLKKREVEIPGKEMVFVVFNRYSITFDASSGRVVTSGYQPITVDRLQ